MSAGKSLSRDNLDIRFLFQKKVERAVTPRVLHHLVHQPEQELYRRKESMHKTCSLKTSPSRISFLTTHFLLNLYRRNEK